VLHSKQRRPLRVSEFAIKNAQNARLVQACEMLLGDHFTKSTPYRLSRMIYIPCIKNTTLTIHNIIHYFASVRTYTRVVIYKRGVVASNCANWFNNNWRRGCHCLVLNFMIIKCACCLVKYSRSMLRQPHSAGARLNRQFRLWEINCKKTAYTLRAAAQDCIVIKISFDY
jgi:hypothetical protein